MLENLGFAEPTGRTTSLKPFFRPRSVAVVGASREPGSLGHRLLDCLLRGGFRGPIYPVNPTADQLAGLRTYPSVLAIPEPVDLAIVAVPPKAVLSVVEECGRKGIGAVVVITAGFAEIGADGRELQDRLVALTREQGLRLIGPNCLGLVATAPDIQLNATFVPFFPLAGTMAVSSDSGALGLAVVVAAARLGMGISSFVSVGNRADVSSNDLLEYWEEDAATRLILLYLESFGNPRRFARIARRVSHRKPIVAVKAGRTRSGQRAAGSHTAALAAGDVPVDALFHQTGIIRADTLEEMFALAALLDGQPLPEGRRVAIVTNAGGPAILCADACEAGGLLVPEFSEKTQADLAAFLPRAAGLKNPVDMIASATAEQYHQALDVVLRSAEVDALIVIYVSPDLSAPDAITQVIKETVALARCASQPHSPVGQKDAGNVGTCIPVLACLMPEPTSPILAVSESEKIPCYAFPEAGAQALSKVAAYAEWRARDQGIFPGFPDVDLVEIQRICGLALEKRGDGWLAPEDTRAILRTTGLAVARGGLASTKEQAVELAQKIGFPVAVKLSSSQIVHKTEIGGVHLNLTNETAVREAFANIRARLAQDNNLQAMEGVLVQPMIQGGTEVMVGVTQDPLFGPLIAFGLGGIHVEVLGDVCFRVTPLSDQDAREMIRGVRAYRLFQGYRGHPPADLPAIEEILLRVSYLAERVPAIRELDLNPIFVLQPGAGCQIVDARIRVAG